MLTITDNGSYKKPSKTVAGKVNTVFRYVVSGSKEEIEKYKAAQKDQLRTNDEGHPLYFTTRYAGKVGKLIISNDKVYVDTSKLDQMSSLIEQNPGLLGEALAKEAAKMLMGNPPVQQEVVEEKKAA